MVIVDGSINKVLGLLKQLPFFAIKFSQKHMFHPLACCKVIVKHFRISDVENKTILFHTDQYTSNG